MEPVLDCRWARKVMDLDNDEQQDLNEIIENAKPEKDVENRSYQVLKRLFLFQNYF
jgi:hypothetical protein